MLQKELRAPSTFLETLYLPQDWVQSHSGTNALKLSSVGHSQKGMILVCRMKTVGSLVQQRLTFTLWGPYLVIEFISWAIFQSVTSFFFWAGINSSKSHFDICIWQITPVYLLFFSPSVHIFLTAIPILFSPTLTCWQVSMFKFRKKSPLNCSSSPFHFSTDLGEWDCSRTLISLVRAVEFGADEVHSKPVINEPCPICYLSR